MKLAARYYVRQEQMNHHDSLYSGVLTDWMTLTAFFGVADVLKRKDHVVMCAVNNFRFVKEVKLGTIMDVCYKLAKVGNSSLTIAVEAHDMLQPEVVYATCEVVFVNTDENGKSAPHGIVMAE